MLLPLREVSRAGRRWAAPLPRGKRILGTAVLPGKSHLLQERCEPWVAAVRIHDAPRPDRRRTVERAACSRPGAVGCKGAEQTSCARGLIGSAGLTEVHLG